MQLNL